MALTTTGARKNPVVGRTTANTTPAYVAKNYTGWGAQQIADRQKQLQAEVARRGQNNNFYRELQDLNKYAANQKPVDYGFGPGLTQETNWGSTPVGQPAAQPTTQPPVETPPATTPTEAPPTTPAPPTSTPIDWATYQSPMTKALLEAYGAGQNTLRAYEPQYFEGSPLYQFQKKQGQGDLAKLLASRGLTGSGAEIQANSDFLAKLGADEAEKQRQYGEAQANRNQSALQFIADFDRAERNDLRDQGNMDAERLQEYQTNQGTREDAKTQTMVSLLNNILGLQAQTSPMTDVYKALGDNNQITSNLAKVISQFQAGDYKKAVPSGGGGGGSSGGASAPPPMAGVDTSKLDMFKILSQYSNSAGNNSLYSTILSGLFG